METKISLKPTGNWKDTQIGKIKGAKESITLGDAVEYKASNWFGKKIVQFSLFMQDKGWISSEKIEHCVKNIESRRLSPLFNSVLLAADITTNIQDKKTIKAIQSIKTIILKTHTGLEPTNIVSEKTKESFEKESFEQISLEMYRTIKSSNMSLKEFMNNDKLDEIIERIYKGEEYPLDKVDVLTPFARKDEKVAVEVLTPFVKYLHSVLTGNDEDKKKAAEEFLILGPLGQQEFLKKFSSI